MSKKLKKKSVSQFEHSFLGHVVFWGLLISISSAIFISNTSMNINTDFQTGIILSFFIYPLLGVIVCLKNSEPEKDGIFSKFKSMFTAGLLFSVLSVILFIIARQLYMHGLDLNIYNEITTFLQIPKAPIAYMMATLSMIASIIALCNSYKYLFNEKKKIINEVKQ